MAWWLVDSIMNGTLEEDYPIKERPKITSSYYDENGDVHLRQDYGDLNTKVHANSPYNDGWTAEHYQKELEKEIDRVELKLNSEDQKSASMAHYFKYHEDEILKDIESYVSGTYRGHYTGTTHEYRNVQTLDLMASRDLASAFCQSNIIKYGSRYGSKDGKSKKDLMKVIHYAMLLLHFDEHYGKPSMTSGNIDHNMP